MRVQVLVLVGAIALGSLGCSGDEATTTTRSPSTTSAATGVISDEEAIRIARTEIEAAFEDFDFEGRTPQVIPVGDTLDVSFPDPDGTVLEAEPHVVLDARSGEVKDRQVRG